MLAIGLVALGVGVVHTILGPDHYLPFIALGRARQWAPRRLAWVTTLCGIGHVGSSVVIALVGVGLGLTLSRLQFWEAWRGGFAAWGLIGFGLLYAVWGLRRAWRRRFADPAGDGHAPRTGDGRLTPWVLFLIFVFGPCEPLIPLLMVPAAQRNWPAFVVVAMIFGASTLATMLALVLTSAAGLARWRLPRWERYAHALAGSLILVCGLAVRFLGL